MTGASVAQSGSMSLSTAAASAGLTGDILWALGREPRALAVARHRLRPSTGGQGGDITALWALCSGVAIPSPCLLASPLTTSNKSGGGVSISSGRGTGTASSSGDILVQTEQSSAPGGVERPGAAEHGARCWR